MSKTKSHTGLRNGNLFCFNCGGSYDMKLPQPVNMVTAMMGQFEKDHKGCPKTWEPPVADMSLSELHRALWWNSGNGEKGMSSEVMWNVMYSNMEGFTINLEKRYHPSDPDDFRRCYLLLQAVPEWRAKLHLMKAVSPVWEKLVDNWDRLTIMLEKMITSQVKSNNSEMYNLMKELGC